MVQGPYMKKITGFINNPKIKTSFYFMNIIMAIQPGASEHLIKPGGAVW